MSAPHQTSGAGPVVLIAEHRREPLDTGITFVHESGAVVRMSGADLEFLTQRYRDERAHLDALGWLQ